MPASPAMGDKLGGRLLFISHFDFKLFREWCKTLDGSINCYVTDFLESTGNNSLQLEKQTINKLEMNNLKRSNTWKWGIIIDYLRLKNIECQRISKWIFLPNKITWIPQMSEKSRRKEYSKNVWYKLYSTF